MLAVSFLITHLILTYFDQITTILFVIQSKNKETLQTMQMSLYSSLQKVFMLLQLNH